MVKENIENFRDTIINAFKSKDPKFRNPSPVRVLLNARKRINEEIQKSQDIVSDEELVQWAIALKATHRRVYLEKSNENEGKTNSEGYELTGKDFTVMTNRSKEVQGLIGEIMNRPITEDQLSLLILNAPGRDCSTEDTPFLKYYVGTWCDDEDSPIGLARIGGLIADEKKSQKFIKALGKMDGNPFNGDPTMTLLEIQCREGCFLENDADIKVCEKGLATILNQEAQKLKKSETNRYHSEKMLETLSDLNERGDVTKIMQDCPLASKALTALQEACIEDYRTKLEKMSPLKERSNIQKRISQRDID